MKQILHVVKWSNSEFDSHRQQFLNKEKAEKLLDELIYAMNILRIRVYKKPSISTEEIDG